jgi:hypothetical protein
MSRRKLTPLQRKAIILREWQIQRATRAAQLKHWGGTIVGPPQGISLPRWRAMVNFIIDKGEPW